MKRSMQMPAVALLLVFAGCGGRDGTLTPDNIKDGSDSSMAVPAATPVPFKVSIVAEGVVALVKKPKANPNRMWALFVNTMNPANLPPGCPQANADRHFPAVRVKSKYLTADATTDPSPMAVFSLEGDDVSLDLASACSAIDPFKLVNDTQVAKVSDFAPTLSTPCTGCAPESSVDVDHVRVAGRFLFSFPVTVVEPIIYNSADVKWCLEKQASSACAKEYTPLGQRLVSVITSCALPEGDSLTLSLTKDANTRRILLYPKDGEIEVELVNLMADDVLVPFPHAKIPRNTVPHFIWFYELSSATTHAGKCPVPRTNDIPPNAAGKPYCPLVEFDPQD